MKEIKIGDRVRFKKFCINHDEEIRVAEGDYGTVVFVDKIGIGVDLDVPQYVSVKATDVELADYDPKTAFLEELKNLLEKYNVDIAVEDGGCNAALYAYFDGEVSIDFWCEEITRQGLKDKQYTIYDKE